MPGPVPKRSDQTIRRNKPDVPIEKIEIIGEVPIPELGITNPEPIVADLYKSMTEAGQKQYFEPTDWHYARLAMILLDQELKYSRRIRKPASAMKIQSLMTMLSNLLVTEGDRRRLRIEVERQSTGPNVVVDVEALFRERMRQNL